MFLKFLSNLPPQLCSKTCCSKIRPTAQRKKQRRGMLLWSRRAWNFFLKGVCYLYETFVLLSRSVLNYFFMMLHACWLGFWSFFFALKELWFLLRQTPLSICSIFRLDFLWRQTCRYRTCRNMFAFLVTRNSKKINHIKTRFLNRNMEHHFLFNMQTWFRKSKSDWA